MVQIDKMSGKPLFEQVILGVKQDILRGILNPGDKILSVREMAAQLMINPNTISKAYKVLEEEDVIVTVRGKGTFVKLLDTETRNDKQINKLKQQFIELVIEASYLNIQEEELIQWIEESSHYFRRS
ncbi:GntR family transcriptional regulator [Vagococcus carniphilus]|uniref:GntR family transcriptional regulator n=1 Tax=Vagococcus carniphilus TaxID=218144 RepID=UPI003B5A0D10